MVTKKFCQRGPWPNGHPKYATEFMNQRFKGGSNESGYLAKSSFCQVLFADNLQIIVYGSDPQGLKVGVMDQIT